MAGNTGSPLCAELNRIANNGVYPDRDDFLEDQGAANLWAGTSGLGILGALNYIVDPTRTDDRFSDLTKVCNELASTTGLSDVDALRTINHPAEVLLKGTTARSASYYVDAATPRYNYPGYIRLDGTAGNYISTPDATALDITGDIDVRVRVALDDWTPSAINHLVAKESSATTRSFIFAVDSTGVLSFNWSADGSARLIKASTVAPTVADGATLWVRAVLDVDNGASGNDLKFYTSNNGTTWTQLGSTVTTAGVTSIFNSTSPVELGSKFLGANEVLKGNLYQAQIYASINDTDKRLDVNLTTNVTSATYNQFTATTGQLVTINGQDTLTNGGTAGSLLPTTVGSSTSADSNDPIFLAHTGTNYVYLPGVASNYLSVPDEAALRITGDIDLRAKVKLNSWVASTGLIAKRSGATASYNFYLESTGRLTLGYTTDGTTLFASTATVATGLADGATKWVRATLDVDNGAAGKSFNFYLSDDGITWTQLGTTVTTAGAITMFASTVPVEFGSLGGGAVYNLNGNLFRAQIFNGIDGTKVFDMDTSVITAGSATSLTALTGQTVTINRSSTGRKSVAVTQPTWLFGTDDYMEVNNRYMAHSTSAENYVYLSGATSNNMSVPDAAPLDITGDIDIQVKVALDDWTPSSQMALVSKWQSTATSRSFALIVSATGNLVFQRSVDSVATLLATSSVATGITDGATKWVRVTCLVNNGAGGSDIKFWLSDDGITWTQLGTTQTTAGTTATYSGTAILEIGSITNGAGSNSRGKFYRAIVKNGIDGTIVLDADASVITLPSQTTFVDRSSNAYTVTINKSGVGTFVSTGNYMYLPGIASNYASAPDSAALDITGDIDIRCKVALDDWTPTASNTLVAKWASSVGLRAYQFAVNTNGTLLLSTSNDGTAVLTANSTVAPTVADGETLWVRVTLDVDNGAAGRTATFFTSTDGITWTQLGSPVVTAGTTSIISNSSILEIGTITNGLGNPARGKFFRAQVLNGIGGTLVFDANFENSITSLLQTSFTESSTNAATVTINRSGSTFRSAGVIDAGYLYPGDTNTFSNSTTDYLNMDATQSFTLFGAVRFWNTGNSGTIVAKGFSTDKRYLLRQATTNSLGYLTDVRTPGNIVTGAETANGTNGQTSSVFGVINRNTQTSQTYLNSVSTATSNISSVGSMVSDLYEFRIGRQSSTAVNYADMELYAAAVFRTATLTTKNLADIQNYFNGRD